MLCLAADEPTPWLSSYDRWRLRRHLERHTLEGLRAQLVNRGRPAAYRGHPGILDALRNDPALMLTGITAAAELHLGLIGGEPRVDAYLARGEIEQLTARYHLRFDLGDANVILRPVAPFTDSWPLGRIAPRSAVALDLLDSTDPRVRQVGADLLASL